MQRPKRQQAMEENYHSDLVYTVHLFLFSGKPIIFPDITFSTNDSPIMVVPLLS